MNDEIKSIICNIKWAQKLKELGVGQETVFHYADCAAFTAQELIALFPDKFKLHRMNDIWRFEFHGVLMHIQEEQNVANVLARILISLIKNRG